MQIGLSGMASLNWPGLMRLRAENALKPKSERTAVIFVFPPGGQSHIDTYDPKPDASSEYRGPFKTISTKVPGWHFTELMLMQAKIADKFTVQRSRLPRHHLLPPRHRFRQDHDQRLQRTPHAYRDAWQADS